MRILKSSLHTKQLHKGQINQSHTPKYNLDLYICLFYKDEMARDYSFFSSRKEHLCSFRSPFHLHMFCHRFRIPRVLYLLIVLLSSYVFTYVIYACNTVVCFKLLFEEDLCSFDQKDHFIYFVKLYKILFHDWRSPDANCGIERVCFIRHRVYRL